ncbi:NADAR family protein [Escherichia coli]|uniref:NADAR family protein n=1 Tax=Escherichia coli TaxID=562 RepID=UPI00399FA2EB
MFSNCHHLFNFYSTSDDYGDFSNFAAWPIKVDGKTWPTSEHYFQAQKFLDEKYREEIRRVSSPMVAARMGRDRSKPLRKNWESVKEQVMRKALRAKFEQHAELRGKARLVLTKDGQIFLNGTKIHLQGKEQVNGDSLLINWNCAASKSPPKTPDEKQDTPDMREY